jgi:hypothetical protein
MAQNIQIKNGVSTHPTANLQSCDRPILVQFERQIALPTPSVVEIQVQVEKDGVFTDVGTKQVSSRDWDSSAGTPIFTFDISSILSAHIGSGFYTSIFTEPTATPVSMTNASDNLSYNSVVKYQVLARIYSVDTDTQELTLNDEDEAYATPETRFVGNIFVKDEVLTTSKYTNLNVDTSWNVDGDADDVQTSKMLSNCPTSLTRKVELGMPLSITTLGRENTSAIGMDIRVVHIKDNEALFTETLIDELFAVSELGIKTVNVTPSDSYLLGAVTDSTEAACGKVLEFFLLGTSGDAYGGDKIKFELYNSSSTSNPNLSKLNPDACRIYFINDFNVLDFYVFDSFVDVTHSNSNSTFKTGYKDYTSRHSSKRGVSRGRTDEIYTCYTIVNRETAEWLSEIYRSTEVYLYEDGVFIPITISSGDVRVAYANKNELEPFSLSFIKDVHVIKG